MKKDPSAKRPQSTAERPTNPAEAVILHKLYHSRSGFSREGAIKMNSTAKEMKKNTAEATVSSAAQQIDNGVTSLELAYDLLQILSDATESEFVPVHPENATEALIFNRLDMYFSAVAILQNAVSDALTELHGGRDSLYDGIRKGGAAV